MTHPNGPGACTSTRREIERAGQCHIVKCLTTCPVIPGPVHSSKRDLPNHLYLYSICTCTYTWGESKYKVEILRSIIQTTPLPPLLPASPLPSISKRYVIVDIQPFADRFQDLHRHKQIEKPKDSRAKSRTSPSKYRSFALAKHAKHTKDAEKGKGIILIFVTSWQMQAKSDRARTRRRSMHWGSMNSQWAVHGCVFWYRWLLIRPRRNEANFWWRLLRSASLHRHWNHCHMIDASNTGSPSRPIWSGWASCKGSVACPPGRILVVRKWSAAPSLFVHAYSLEKVELKIKFVGVCVRWRSWWWYRGNDDLKEVAGIKESTFEICRSPADQEFELSSWCAFRRRV